MALTVEAARLLWASLPLPVGDGLAVAQMRRAEQALGFEFNPDHRALLTAGMPRGGRWPDWTDPEGLKDRLTEPIEGIVFDVEENGFWRQEWGPRPVRVARAVEIARESLARVPTLVPVYGHRFTPALPEPGLPVYSVVQSDVIVYGADLAGYLIREFGAWAEADLGPIREVPFWSDLI